jgi:two-component system, OmpR family, alkaline phosphatase synthesis response regulator PhoP
MKKILLIEDDQDLAKLIELHMKDQNIDLDFASDGELGLSKALSENYSLVILDLMLPKLNGMDVCREIRSKQNQTPILMLTSKSEELDKLIGFEAGADDYLTKPFSIRELIARVNAHIRRSESYVKHDTTDTEEDSLIFEKLHISLSKRLVKMNKENIELTAKEFDLLALFARHPGRSFSRQNLLELVWGYQYSGYEHTVNSHINRLRSKIESDPSRPHYIQTVWGYGYRFMEN